VYELAVLQYQSQQGEAQNTFAVHNLFRIASLIDPPCILSTDSRFPGQDKQIGGNHFLQRSFRGVKKSNVSGAGWG
jgi:hypothetical protein